MIFKIGCSLISVLALTAAAASAQPTTGSTAATASPHATVATAPTPAATATEPTAPPTPATTPAPDVSATPPAPETAPSASAAAGQSAQAPLPGAIPPPPAGKGQVVFFRPSGFIGMAVWFNVRENGTALGKLSNGAYFVQVADPGPHTYTAATENKNVLHMEIDDGETYYVRGSVQMGVLIGEADMTPSDQATFEKAFKKMHLAKPPTPETKPAAVSDSSKSGQ